MTRAGVNGVNLYYELHGEGPPLVFISGTGFHCQIWKPYQVPFFSRSFRVLITDHRGVGLSDKPDEPYSTKIFADDIAGLMSRVGHSPAHIIGHSMGGRVAQWIAIEHPELVRSLILASSGSGNFASDPNYVRGIPLDAALAMAELGYPKYLRNHVQSEFYFTKGFAKKEPKRFKEVVGSHLVNPPPLKAYLRHVVARQMHETTDRLGEISAPTLITVGEGDATALGTGSHFLASEVLKERISNSEMVIIKRANHGTFWERPDESNKVVLDFLKHH